MRLLTNKKVQLLDVYNMRHKLRHQMFNDMRQEDTNRRTRTQDAHKITAELGTHTGSTRDEESTPVPFMKKSTGDTVETK